MKVLITRVIPRIAENLLKEKGYEVIVFKEDRPINKDELIDLGKDCDAILSLLTDKIDKKVISSFENCKVISNYAVGYNNIDVEYAGSKGITVTNTPDILTNATADLAMALTLACARNLKQGDDFIRNGKFSGWKPELLLGVELTGKNFGVVGAGRIGYETARRARAFGCNILYYNRSVKPEFEEELNATKLDLDTLLSNSDIVSLHVPLTEQTYHLLNGNNLTRLKEKSILINTARGEVIDEKVLINMLKSGKIFAAGFDVFEGEPDINKELYKLENTVLLPHVGSATFEARGKMALLCAKNIIEVLENRKAITPV